MLNFAIELLNEGQFDISSYEDVAHIINSEFEEKIETNENVLKWCDVSWLIIVVYLCLLLVDYRIP